MQDVMQTRIQQAILDTGHGQGGAMDTVHRLLMMKGQVTIYNVITLTPAKSIITANIIFLIANNYYCHASKNILITQVCAFANPQTWIPSSLAVDICFALLFLSIHYV